LCRFQTKREGGAPIDRWHDQAEVVAAALGHC
jgi:hypothetical protein